MLRKEKLVTAGEAGFFEKNSMTGIYTIRNFITGKVYVGSAVNIEKRFGEHIRALKRGDHCNIHLQRAWNKYCNEAFDFEVYLVCDSKDLIRNEQLVIDAMITRVGRRSMYNICPTAGSSLGTRHSKLSRIKIGLASKGRWSGKKHTEETKKKISLGNTGKRLGKRASLETRKKMSDSKKGIKFTEEHRKKIGDANKRRVPRLGWHHSEESKRKMSESLKRTFKKKKV